MLRIVTGTAALLLVTGAAANQTRCEKILAHLSEELADASCVESADLTTQNPATTPANNAITSLPAFAFTPQTDRSVIAPSAAKRTPITKAVPGVQIQARFADDPLGQGRFLLRLPDHWNGGLVVAGASGTRSEFNGDFAWSDYVVQQGYAYASQNKGVLNLRFSTAADPLACRLNPASPLYVTFYDNDPGQQFSRWRDFMVAAARVARRGVNAHYGTAARYTYAVGTSNGGYQVRRAIETAPELFDGGVDWEGTFVDPHAPNLLTDLPAGVRNFGDYATGNPGSPYAPNGTAAKNIVAAGYPPDIVVTTPSATLSLWGNYWTSFWEVTQCQWQKRLDPTFDTYANAGTATYNYVARLSQSDVAAQLASFATTGKIKRPLITVAGTMDALLPIDHHARAYARLVHARDAATTHRDDDEAAPESFAPYRLYEIQNGNHIETYQDTFPQLELIEPHAQQAFDLLVQHVQGGAPLPPDQCVARSGTILAAPSTSGHCAALFVP